MLRDQNRTLGSDGEAETASPRRERNKRGFERFLLFTDAVVAIAVTLLILPVVERASDISGTDLSVGDILRESDAQIFSFLLSFVVIAFMWLEHQKVFQNVESVNRRLIWASLAWLLTVIFLAFTTALIPLHDASAAPLYIANVALSSFMLSLCITLVARHPALLYADTSVDDLHLRESWVATGLLALAVLLVALFPAIGYFALLLVMLQGPAQHLLHRDRQTQ